MKGSATELLGRMDTTTLSDALDRLGIEGQCAGIRPLVPGSRMSGPVFTIRYVPCGTHGGTVGDYIDDLQPGTVVALDNQGRMDATVWGDILTTVAHRRELGGTLIDGVCRDASRSVELGYPIFSRGSYMRTGKDRVAVDATQVSIAVGGVRVEPGDFVVGDWDGVVVIPKQRTEQVLQVAQEIEEAEDRIRQLILQGSRLDEVRVSLKYHNLQTRIKP